PNYLPRPLDSVSAACYRSGNWSDHLTAVRGYATLLKAVKRTRIPEDIVDQVFQLVQDGVLKPGDRLPPERELAPQLDVSRASVREAMRLMDTKGLVVIRPGSGTFVTEDTVAAIVQAFSALLSDESGVAGDIFEMRLLLEPQVVSLAAERADEADIRQMEAALITVWDNIELAEFFVRKAGEDAEGKGDIRLRWCLFISASGLWSAASIFNRNLARDDERLSEQFLLERRRRRRRHAELRADREARDREDGDEEHHDAVVDEEREEAS
ncbi:MAG: FadR family transcriptional regulator, partial [Planctomycetes bacterium]|nr:FadR family transcriptional regulator [Planctomycetota bacterium]